MRKIAISDIHGCNKTFHKLLSSLGLDKSDQLVLLGDYIDRGPDSKGVLDTILSLQEQGYKVQCLRGNHEEMLLDAFQSDADYEFWHKNGGRETLESFGVQRINQIPAKYIDFIGGLDLYYEETPFIYVHAGLNMRTGAPYAHPEAMMWIRDWYQQVDSKWLAGRIIIHGHTPKERICIRESLENLDELPVINIDNGCYYDKGYYPLGYHGLCALVAYSNGETLAQEPGPLEVYFQKCLDEMV